ncbi:hypothetical protein F9278_27925 [Streptomyces phaeolivaceus]|uniref:Uncharacterized protein n=1 Tax=Streptomyces phaeolivaceus TaxID=2653200 RepID=A0A5P8K7P6_9ACTN|nr:hypothetical protein [Streptomyces phaeolivaceus]QFQ99343.1 hypothetical protein F9278_27925 [Streptomyces phaeolivaceus]
MANEPDVAFGLHPTLGTVAAVSDGLPQAEAALHAAGFDHHKELDIFVLPQGADRRAIVQLIRDLQAIGYSVAADPHLQEPLPVSSIRALTSRIVQAQHPTDIADVFDDLLDDRVGALPELHQLLESTAEWCERRLGDEGADLARVCRHLGHKITELSVDLGFTGADFLDLDSPLPPRSTATAPSPQNSRARAAATASPARSATSKPATTNSPAPYRSPQSPCASPTLSR